MTGDQRFVRYGQKSTAYGTCGSYQHPQGMGSIEEELLSKWGALHRSRLWWNLPPALPKGAVFFSGHLQNQALNWLLPELRALTPQPFLPTLTLALLLWVEEDWEDSSPHACSLH